VLVADVRRRSAAAAAGLVSGDRILAINGHVVRDAIDFQFHAGDACLHLAVQRGGRSRTLTLRREVGDLGVELVAPQPREISTCDNACVFCFIHQNPKGLRRSLYVKDDDFRLSFLHGNYITLTDLDETELARILEQHLSPLYVSVHATDPELRARLLGRLGKPAAILPRLERLAQAGIVMHAQIVLCPGLNDGAQLDRTVHELAPLYPQVATTAIVPVGLTRHRERLPALRALRLDEAAALVDTVHTWQQAFLPRLGSRFVFLGDEIYLLAGRPLPAAEAYEGFPIAEDGIGLVRRFEDGWSAALRSPGAAASARPRRPTIVTGTMYAARLIALITPLVHRGVTAQVVAVPNRLFGEGIGVAGLMSGADIRRVVASVDDHGDEVLVPSVAVRETDGVFLDDLTPTDLGRDLGLRVRVVEAQPLALLRALVGR
jgi:putative radical SAM enzyme (TIGR03279 family)